MKKLFSNLIMTNPIKCHWVDYVKRNTKFNQDLQMYENLSYIHSKKICPMLHQKGALICWLQKFVLSCTTINGELHQKMVKSSDKSTKIWCSLRRIFVASKSVLLFGAT